MVRTTPEDDYDRKLLHDVKELQPVRLLPTYAAAHQNLGSVLAQLRKKEEAVQAFRKAVQLDPGSASHHHSLGLALLNLFDSASVPEGIQELRESVRPTEKAAAKEVRSNDEAQERAQT